MYLTEDAAGQVLQPDAFGERFLYRDDLRDRGKSAFCPGRLSLSHRKPRLTSVFLEMTIEAVLEDPVIALVNKADDFDRGSFAEIIATAARKLRRAATNQKRPGRVPTGTTL
jgi:hypothetical protein